ncbi:ModD protein [Heliobacterium chlorum]|uniref:Putative pyrophosphorylase ModD n=1 Tax=Heliobacterium chlorum TaxID=2698 RepID=A0ABR7T558_HELCL|nr:ModD protein [Heliobacterium chlorum]MBC9785138.1 ModD protein [Heliobacterium chlorum]
MMYIAEETIEKLIREDVPYIDLTSLVLGIDHQEGVMRYSTREEAVLCGTEEAQRILLKLGCQVRSFVASGAIVQPGDTVLEAIGPAGRLHMAWKVTANLLEYCSGVATRTKRLIDLARMVNPHIQVVTTRKSVPGAKDTSVKGMIAGGGLPHRLGLSETILVFKQHLNFIGGIEGLLMKLDDMKRRCCEKKILVEVESLDEALRLSAAGVDGIQFDKFSLEKLQQAVDEIRKINPQVTLIGTGGINEKNVAQYASTGIDVINTSSVFFGKPIDMAVTIHER